MDTFEAKKTPIDGLYEIAYLTEPDVRDERISQLIKWLGFDITVNGSYTYSNMDTFDSDTKYWHIDGNGSLSIVLLTTEMGTEISRIKFNDTLHHIRYDACIIEPEPDFVCEPNKLYVMKGTIYHRAPAFIEGRKVCRTYLSRMPNFNLP